MPSDASSREDLTDGRDRLTLLLELTNSFVSKLELPDVATAVMRAARRVMRSDSAVVALPDAHSRHLRACALDCPGGDDLPRDNDLIDGEGAVAAQVFRTGLANRASLVPSFFAALRKKFAISIFCPQ